MSRRRRISNFELADELERNDNPELGRALREIGAACSTIQARARRAVEMCEHPLRAGDVTVVPAGERTHEEPAHERAFAWLDAMRVHLRELLREQP